MTDDDRQELDLVILSGDPTPEELAAVTATLTAMIDERADDAALAHVTGPSAWQRSQRPIRAPLSPGRGAWRGFSG